MIVMKSEFGGKSGDAARFMVSACDLRGTERGAHRFGRTGYSARTGFDQSLAIGGGVRRLRSMKGGLITAGVGAASTGGVRPVAERGLPGFVHAATPRPQGAAGACPWRRPA